MTQDEKFILLQDLCTRIPYGVKFMLNKNIYTAKGIDLIVTDEGDWEYAVTAKGIKPIEIGYIKPYLRPISSITLEELRKYKCFRDHIRDSECKIHIVNYAQIDWFIANHFDYRGLIPMGIALPATEGMYNLIEKIIL